MLGQQNGDYIGSLDIEEYEDCLVVGNCGKVASVF